MKKYGKHLFRVLLFAAVILLVLRKTDFSQVHQTLAKVGLLWMVFAFLCYTLRFVMQGLRWYLAAKAHDQILPVKTTLRSQLEISFLEIAFPIPDSEDGLKIVYMHRQNIAIAPATAIILYDRMIGVTILLLLLPFSFLVFAENVLPVYLQSSWIPVVFLLFAFPLALYHRNLISSLFIWADRYLPSKTNWRQALRNELEKKIAPRLVITCLTLGFTHALFGVATAWLLVKALGAQASFIFLLAGIPLYYISAILPLSIQGLGLYETALVFILKQQGIDTETALAVGILHLLFHFIEITCGGIIHLFSTDKESFEKTFVHWTRKLISYHKTIQKP